jgi:hypothetical protein
MERHAGREGKQRKQALLFLKKKKQKNFYFPRAVALPSPTPPMSKSFLLLFFKKEALAFL